MIKLAAISSQQEIVALLTMYHLIAGLDSAGMLQRHWQSILQNRNTWYLDAWCHTSKELKRFALDAIRPSHILCQIGI